MQVTVCKDSASERHANMQPFKCIILLIALSCVFGLDIIDERANPVTDVAFVCTEAGLFVDPNSNCGKYFNCTLRDGTNEFDQVEESCDLDHIFDVDTSQCIKATNGTLYCPPPPTCNSNDFYCVTDKIVQFCKPENLYPSGDTQPCVNDRICNENCQSFCIPPSALNSSLCSSTETSTPTTTTTTETITTTTSKPQFQCTQQGLFQDSSDCQAFFLCAEFNGLFEQLYFQCPEGYAFDPDLQTCAPEATVNCGTSPSPSFQCSQQGFFQDSNDCHAFYLCAGNDGLFEQLYFQCPEGYAFDPDLQTCAPEAIVNCGTSPSPSFQCSQQGFFQDSNDCHAFYLCAGNDGLFEQLYFQCPEGYAFDPDLQTCAPEATVNCTA
ncbi:hypothetical protein C0J52_14539 [Blattella germanica]|nr:hypothetical protein C0J52_14539 [Blattella germanica]